MQTPTLLYYRHDPLLSCIHATRLGTLFDVVVGWALVIIPATGIVGWTSAAQSTSIDAGADAGFGGPRYRLSTLGSEFCSSQVDFRFHATKKPTAVGQLCRPDHRTLTTGHDTIKARSA